MIVKIQGKVISDSKESREMKITNIKAPSQPTFYRKNMFLSISPLTPLALVDWKFLALAGGIFTFALMEKKFAEYGFVSVSKIIYNSMGIIIPLGGCIAFLYIISKAANIFMWGL